MSGWLKEIDERTNPPDTIIRSSYRCFGWERPGARPKVKSSVRFGINVFKLA